MKAKTKLSSTLLQDLVNTIPEKHITLEHILEFKTDYWSPEVPVLVLSPTNRDVPTWYNEFEEVISNSIKKRRFVPVLRASDGEFRFLLGPQPPSRREHLFRWTKSYVKYVLQTISFGVLGFRGQTAPGVSVGNYSPKELHKGRSIFAEGVHFVCERGILAAHLQFTPRPFQEHYHSPLKRFLDKQLIVLGAHSYVPFYFVYLYLSRVTTAGILNNHRVLFINGASDEKRRAIDERFHKYGVKSTRWISLSKDRSLFDRIKLSAGDLESDICILGGGVGKYNIVQQLADFPGPVIDAGYYFEAWANPAIAGKRPLCIV